MKQQPHVTEHAIQADILKVLGVRPDLRIWRQNTGQAWTGNEIFKIDAKGAVQVSPGDVVIRRAHPIQFGIPGASDLLAIMSPLGRLLSIEVKSPTGRQSDQQKLYQAMIERFGGVYLLARSVDEARQGIDKARG